MALWLQLFLSLFQGATKVVGIMKDFASERESPRFNVIPARSWLIHASCSVYDSHVYFRRSLESVRLDQASFSFQKISRESPSRRQVEWQICPQFRTGFPQIQTRFGNFKKSGRFTCIQIKSELACCQKQTYFLIFCFHELLLAICSDNSFQEWNVVSKMF